MKDILATTIHGVTMVGVNTSSYPVKRGNCFSVGDAGEGHYQIVNFSHENLREVLRCNLVQWPIKIRTIDKFDRVAVITDSRIPDEWFDTRFCSVCCPESLLPMPQRLQNERDEERGIRIPVRDSVGNVVAVTYNWPKTAA